MNNKTTHNRRYFLQTLGLTALSGALFGCSDFMEKTSKGLNMQTQDNLGLNLFVGHGSPMNAIEDNKFSRAQKEIMKHRSIPKAVIIISAHWVAEGINIVSSTKPKIIYDFYGFPIELHNFKYEAKGEPNLAKSTANLINENKKFKAFETDSWGLDHGAWSVLAHLFPKADVPVFQLSLNSQMNFLDHLELARELRELRKQNIMILSSGNIVHNLRMLRGEKPETPHDFALEFDEWAKKKILSGDGKALATFEGLNSKLIQASHPTLEHYLPLIYTMGASFENERFEFPIEGFQEKAISMRSVLSKKA